MQYSVIDGAGKIEAKVEAEDVRQACRVWAERTLNQDLVEQKVLKARLFKVSDNQAAHLDPYLLAPVGLEHECLRKNEEILKTDLHFAPDPGHGQPRQVDTGGQG